LSSEIIKRRHKTHFPDFKSRRRVSRGWIGKEKLSEMDLASPSF